MKDYTTIYKINDIYKIYKARKGQIACYVCCTLLMLVASVVLYVFIENDGLYLLSESLLMLLFITYSLYMFLLKFPKSKWYVDFYLTLDDGYKTISPLRFVETQENDDKTTKVIFTRIENEEKVELLILNSEILELDQQDYFIAHVGKYIYGYKNYEK